ncbi:hypothetical protein PtA15_7A356 [Puccinia triticina]|uniref:CSC1/OSCA1-like 7TM region domain-containing protein n=1 Tax=Puccinia triticina TaxID=208348 RepID=A0ABY7CN94_9BASI|nr:uncharacterized protein PtA15_7A356 [Puccinia triticina]WAQ86629.1 hypothetical protein PtA15_7A356 [Puccinia triticina]
MCSFFYPLSSEASTQLVFCLPRKLPAVSTLSLAHWGHREEKVKYNRGSQYIVTNMSNLQASYTVQSIALHQFLAKLMKLDPPKPVPTILLSAAFLEPLAGVLYALSSIPAIRQQGFWLVKVEKNGMIRPNTRTLIPMFVLVYIAFSMTTIHSFQKDLKKSVLSTATVTLSLSTYPFMMCAGWTKIWNILRALPLTKYGLVTRMRQTNAGSTMTYFKPRTINLISLFFFIFPFAFAGPPIYLITLHVIEINRIYKQYNDSFLAIISGQLQPTTILNLNIDALTQVAIMRKRADAVLFLSRFISGGYCLNIIILFFMMLFGYFRILQAVQYQIRTFRQALQETIPLSLGIQSSENVSKLQVQPTPVSTNFNTSITDDISKDQRQKPLLVSKNILKLLPSFRDNPDFLEKPRSSTSSNNSLSNSKQPWEINNRAAIQSQCKALKIYQVNLIWQVLCNTTVMLVLVVMDSMILFNYLQIPTRHTLSDLNWFTITVANVTWIMTIGIPFGLVAAIVAFSSPITSLREKSEVVEECDY